MKQSSLFSVLVNDPWSITKYQFALPWVFNTPKKERQLMGSLPPHLGWLPTTVFYPLFYGVMGVLLVFLLATTLYELMHGNVLSFWLFVFVASYLFFCAVTRQYTLKWTTSSTVKSGSQ